MQYRISISLKFEFNLYEERAFLAIASFLVSQKMTDLT